MTGRTIVVLAAHGSRLAAANDAHGALVARVATELGGDVVPGFLELVEPSIGAAIDGAVTGGATRVLVLPYFLHPGNHTSRDIPAIVEEARARHPDASIDVLPLFGADAALSRLISAQLRAALG